MQQSLLPIILVILLNILLGLFVLSRNPKSKVNLTFFVVVLSISLWALTNYLVEESSFGLSLNQFANSLTYAFAFLAVFSGLVFTYLYPMKRSVATWNKSMLALMSILFVLSFTPLVTGEVYLKEGELAYTIGKLLPFYIISILTMLILIGVNLYSTYKLGNSQIKNQAILVFLAFSIPIIIALISNAIIPLYVSNWQTAYYGPVLTIFLVGTITYAIVKHSLFDIRPVFARAAAYVLSISVIMIIFTIIAFSVTTYLMDIEITLQQEMLLALLSAFIATLYRPIKNSFDKVSNNLFYRDAYEPQEIINKINSTLVNTTDLHKLLTVAGGIIDKELNLEYAEFYLDPKASIEYHLVGSNSQLFNKPELVKVIEYIADSNTKILVKNEGELDPDIIDGMRQLNLECAVKMRSSDDEVGVLLVGERKSGNRFTQRDLQLLEIIADEVAIAVQNSLRYEEISQFNVTLQNKIDNATKELQQTNEKLRSLDDAKDEFISMASHQLRTPLTSIKGYISMILEGDAGDVTDQQKNFLNQAFISSQRMVFLISDLLNVSRLKTGKFVIEKSEVDLPGIVEMEVEQLAQTAESRGLTLDYKPPKDYPTLQLDETKTMQVIMNFIDNAIYYTRKGGKIKIILESDDKSATYKVIDNGIGVPKNAQHELFTKFYRAENAKNARPDGTGLGLYMAKKVIIAQGGHIIFESQEGKGSTFGFSFPLKDENIET